MHHPREVPRLQPPLAEERGDAGRDRARGVVVGGEDLPADLAAGVVVVDDDVGERAPDVDPERVAGHGRSGGWHGVTLGPHGREIKPGGVRVTPCVPSRSRG